MVRCAIWYHLYNLKDVKNTYGGVLILVKLQAPATLLKLTFLHGCFSTMYKLYKWFQIAQRITYKKECQLNFFYCNYAQTFELGVVKNFHVKILITRYFMITSLFKNCVWLQQFHISTESFNWHMFYKKFCQKENM